MNILMIRHPSVNCPEGTCYGQSDIPLAQNHVEEIEHLRSRLPEMTGFTIYTSPLQRCQMLAEAIAPHGVIRDDDLMELDFGDWEGRKWSELPVDEVHAWSEDFVHIAPPGGETCEAMMERCKRFWDKLIQRGEDAIVVSHTGWIRLALAQVLNIDPTHAFRIHIDFCGITRVERRKGWMQVMYINR